MDGRNRLNEISLHDAPRDPRPPWLERAWQAWLSTRGRKAIPVVPTGDIIEAPGGLEVGTRWAVQDIFRRATFGFSLTKHFTDVSFAESPDSPRPDILHWTCPMPLSVAKAGNLYTIHDLAPLRLPYATLENKRMFHSLCERICREADHVVTVSETARREIIQMFGIEERRITNTYQAVAIPKSLMDRPMDEVGADLESIFNLRLRKYFLFFGAIEPKKNLPRLIEAYLSSNVRDPLVIVGGQGWLAEQETALLYDDLLEARVLSEGLWRRADRIRRYDYLPQALLVSLVRGAKAVMFPSLYEGFGLPLLEAMQLGTPVVASTGGALPEIAGDAAVLVDPFDVTAIKRAIFEVGSDEGLCATLSERGRARAGEFSASAYEARLGRLYGAFI